MVSTSASDKENTKGNIFVQCNGVLYNYLYLSSPTLCPLKSKTYFCHCREADEMPSNLTSTRGWVLVEPLPLKHVQINVSTKTSRVS